jgi:hypothetical protein
LARAPGAGKHAVTPDAAASASATTSNHRNSIEGGIGDKEAQFGSSINRFAECSRERHS